MFVIQIGEPISRGLDYAPLATSYHTGAAAPVPRYVTRPEPIPSNFVYPGSHSRRNETQVTLIGARQGRHYNNFGYDETDCDSPSVTDLVDSVGAADVTNESTVAEVDTTTLMKKNEEVQIQKAEASQDDYCVTDLISMTEGTLSCPNCHRRFSRDEHVDLMFHLDVCA